MEMITTAIDSFIANAENLGVEIEYIAMGPKVMKRFAEELTIITGSDNDGIDFTSVAKYREIPIRETQVNDLTVKYIVTPSFWGELN